jgi:hypothetical protein
MWGMGVWRPWQCDQVFRSCILASCILHLVIMREAIIITTAINGRDHCTESIMTTTASVWSHDRLAHEQTARNLDQQSRKERQEMIDHGYNRN